jgi:hypothetical protein
MIIPISQWGSPLKYIPAFSLVFFTGLALANEPGKTDTGLHYNNFEVDYSSATISSSTYTGYYTSGSFLITDNIYTLLNFSNYSKSGSSSYEKTNLGLGYRMPIAPAVDVQTSISYYTHTYSGTKSGYNLSVGARAKLSGEADLTGTYSFIDIGSKSYNNFSLGIKYAFTDMFYASGAYQSQSGGSTSFTSAYLIGLGLKF